MNYIIDQCYEFPVAEPDSPQDDYFKLSVSTASGRSTVMLKNHIAFYDAAEHARKLHGVEYEVGREKRHLGALVHADRAGGKRPAGRLR